MDQQDSEEERYARRCIVFHDKLRGLAMSMRARIPDAQVALLGRMVMRAFSGITTINIYFMKVYRYLIIAMMVAMVYEVFARYAADSPTVWSYELTGMLVGPLWLFAAGYTMVRNENIRLDMLYGRFPLRVQGAVDMVTWLLFFLFVGSVMYYGWDAFYSSYESQAHSGSLWRPIQWPWKLTVPIASGLLLLQGIVVYAGAIYKTIVGRQPPWLPSG